MSKYILLNQKFCEDNTGYKNKSGEFNYGITKDGKFVAASQTLDDFPEIFENTEFHSSYSVLELHVSDFPTSKTP